jgi:hypothetical protein
MWTHRPNTNKPVGGLIAYYRLADWWLSEFTEDERGHVTNKFQPLGFSGDRLNSGTISYTSEHVVSFLSNLAGWFNNAEDRSLARKLLRKAVAILPGSPVLDAHFLHQQVIEVYYKDRDIPEYLAEALSACRAQIAIAPAAARAFQLSYDGEPLPSHKGYEQLSIVLEKGGQYHEVIDLCRRAQLEGWAGDWSHRAQRCANKASKL